MNNNQKNNILIYEWNNGKLKFEVHLENETVWLSQKQMWELFDCTKENVILHLKNIFKTYELNENSVTKDFLVTASDWKNYNTKHYNLDAIIAVWYRVKSLQWTHFRIWATERLKEYIVKGFTMDDERLKSAWAWFIIVQMQKKNIVNIKLKHWVQLKKNIWKI